MDRLGKQLTLFSFGIIGESDAMLILAWSAVKALCAPGPLFSKVLVDVGYLDFGGSGRDTSEGEIWGGLIAYSVPQQQLKQVRDL